MANDARTTEDEVPAGGTTAPGPNRFTDKGTTVEDVTPLPNRSGGPDDPAREQ